MISETKLAHDKLSHYLREIGLEDIYIIDTIFMNNENKNACLYVSPKAYAELLKLIEAPQSKQPAGTAGSEDK